jgi:hypothetical protein
VAVSLDKLSTTKVVKPVVEFIILKHFKKMEKSDTKTYTVDEIRKIAPGYRGKPENFNPTKVGKKPTQSKPKRAQNNAADTYKCDAEAN